MVTEGKNNGDDSSAHGWDPLQVEPGRQAAGSGDRRRLWVCLPHISPSRRQRGRRPLAIAGAHLDGRFAGPGPYGNRPGRGTARPPSHHRCVLTTPFFIWRLFVGHWAARAAQDQARVAQETARNTLFTKAIEQLGATREEKKTVATLKKFTSSLETIAGATDFHDETNTVPNTEVRLGAIYALEKLARDDLEIHWPIMETLCAYVRENAGKPKPLTSTTLKLVFAHWKNRLTEEDPVETSRGESDRPSVDVQAAITVIGRRGAKQLEYERSRREDKTPRTTEAWRLDLSNCHLALANFVGLDFTAAQFSGSSLYLSDFRGTTLKGRRSTRLTPKAHPFDSLILRVRSQQGSHRRCNTYQSSSRGCVA